MRYLSLLCVLLLSVACSMPTNPAAPSPMGVPSAQGTLSAQGRECTQTWLHIPIGGGGQNGVYTLYVDWHMAAGTLVWTTMPDTITITQIDMHRYQTSPLPQDQGTVHIIATDSSGCAEIEVYYPPCPGSNCGMRVR